MVDRLIQCKWDWIIFFYLFSVEFFGCERIAAVICIGESITNDLAQSVHWNDFIALFIIVSIFNSFPKNSINTRNISVDNYFISKFYRVFFRLITVLIVVLKDEDQNKKKKKINQSKKKKIFDWQTSFNKAKSQFKT